MSPQSGSNERSAGGNLRWLVVTASGGGAVRLLSAVAALVAIRLLVDAYGDAGAGQLLFLAATLPVIGGISRLGGEFPLASAQADPQVYHAYVSAAVVVALACGFIVALVNRQVLLGGSSSGQQVALLLALVAGLIGTALAFSQSSIALAQGRPVVAAVLSFAVPSFMLLLSAVTAWGAAVDSPTALLVYLVGLAVLGFGWSLYSRVDLLAMNIRAGWRWMLAHKGVGAVQVVQLLIAWLPLGVLAAREDLAGVTAWTAAMRVSMLVSFGFLVVSQGSVGRIARFNAQESPGALQRFLTHAWLMGVVCCVPPIVFLGVFAEEVIDALGLSTDGATTLLVALCCYQAVNALGGAVMQLLLTLGHQRVVFRLQVIALALIGGGAWWVHETSAVAGLGMLWALALAGVQFAAVVSAYRLTGYMSVPLLRHRNTG